MKRRTRRATLAVEREHLSVPPRGLLRVLGVSMAIVSLASGCGSSGGQTSTRSRSAAPAATSSVPARAATSSAPAASTRVHALPPGVLASIPVSSPAGIGFGFGSVWVGAHRATQLYRIDPNTNRVVATIDVGQEACGTPSAGFGRMWVPSCSGGISVVNPKTNEVVAKVPYPGLLVAFGAGSIWIADAAMTYRVDPKTLKTKATLNVGGPDVTFAAGSVWVSNDGNGTVAKIDPARNKVIATIPTGGINSDENHPRYVAGRLWVYPDYESPAPGDEHLNKIWQIDPDRNTVTERTLPVNLIRGWPAAGMGSLWVGGPKKVYRFDPQTLRPLAVYPAGTPVAGDPEPINVGFGSLWVSDLDNNRVWRDRIQG
jgi:virginiamycin B lyase